MHQPCTSIPFIKHSPNHLFHVNQWSADANTPHLRHDPTHPQHHFPALKFRFKPQSSPIIPRNYSKSLPLIQRLSKHSPEYLCCLHYCASASPYCAPSCSPNDHKSIQIPNTSSRVSLPNSLTYKYFATFFAPAESFLTLVAHTALFHTLSSGSSSTVDPRREKKSKNLNVIILRSTKPKLLGSHRPTNRPAGLSFLNRDPRFDLERGLTALGSGWAPTIHRRTDERRGGGGRMG